MRHIEVTTLVTDNSKFQKGKSTVPCLNLEGILSTSYTYYMCSLFGASC